MSWKIYDMLPVGEQNAISRRELMRRTGYSDRKLRLAITEERKAGALILSSVDGAKGGYYRYEPGNATELRRFIASMSRRAKSTFYVLKAAKAELEKIEAEEAAKNGESGQESLFTLL